MDPAVFTYWRLNLLNGSSIIHILELILYIKILQDPCIGAFFIYGPYTGAHLYICILQDPYIDLDPAGSI